jgi:hypothetical protein
MFLPILRSSRIFYKLSFVVGLPNGHVVRESLRNTGSELVLIRKGLRNCK